MNITKHYNNKDSDNSHILYFADHLKIDFGAMTAKVDNVITRSHEGYNCYLLIVNHHTQYTYDFLSCNKAPPLRTITQFLRTYCNTDGVWIVCTDQGGELARSVAFKETIIQAEYHVEVTGTDNSGQNAISEHLHKHLDNMVGVGLENAVLHMKYWSDALLHAVFSKTVYHTRLFTIK